jgi:hypothetical protein
VVVLRGRNDAGKSETLKAVSRLLGGKADVSCRDGAVRGEIEGFGARVTLGRSVRSTGELEAIAIEGSLPVAELVDPGLKDPAAADARRIKALLYLTGATADPARFYDLLPGGKAELERYVFPQTLTSTDLVEMAAKVKRDLEAAARSEEALAHNEDGKAAADRNAGDGLDLSAPTDIPKLQAALEQAAATKGTLDGQAREARRAKAEAEEARKALEKATGSGKSVSECSAAEAAAKADLIEARTRARDLKVQWEAARSAEGAAYDRMVAAEEQSAAVQRTANATAGWQAAIDAAADVWEPTADDLNQAAACVQQARQALETAAVVRAAKARLAKAAAHQEAAAEHRKTADRLREAGRGTDDVLSAAVDSDTLSVKAGRLITQHPERGEVFFAERSDGTRWRIALDEAIRRIRQLGQAETAIIPVPQRAWSECDGDARRAIHAYAVEQGVTILTAEADRDVVGELRAEEYEP